ncbi:UNKNOWN [Stylonychia lemnae]|uniref:Uncharacterized protein n=1 Tax=Stylonychia lemnae TaxID=5949 RepID=A0A078AKF3_STYLE|nr:UNKNOWN [Stylonychia lemnae]|eukprot:CDW81298.1 UNKNOWN [Stylonychia lemnae]
MYQPLIDILQKKGKIVTSETGEVLVEIKDVFQTLHSTEFLNITPLFLNHRETYANIKLIITSVIITRRAYLSGDEIRQGIIAYTLISRECKSEWLPMYVEKIIKTFRMVNKTVSEVVLKKWFEHVRSNLECNMESRIQVEKEIKQKKLDVPFLLPHEFLFLLCNCSNRLETISRLHNPELVSVKGNIYQWELSNPLNQGTFHQSHIHLLPQTAFTNQAPHIIITNTLNKEAEEKNIRVMGMKPQQSQNQISVINSQSNEQNKSPSKSKLLQVKAAHGSSGFAQQLDEMKTDLKNMKHSAVAVLGNAKKFLQRFQSPYLEIIQNASQGTIDRINSPLKNKDNVFLTQPALSQDLRDSPEKRKRPQTAKIPLSNRQIQERNRTFMHVSKINLKRAQALKQQEIASSVYRPPDKNTMRSQFSEIFSEKDQFKECQVMGRNLASLNVSKSRESLNIQKKATERIKNWMFDELNKYEEAQTEKSKAMATTAIDGNSEACGVGVGSSKKFEKMLDYVQNFSKQVSYSSMPKRRPISSYSYRTTLSQAQTYKKLNMH